MDRFIVLDLALKSGIDFDLKSSMDRFIVFNITTDELLK